MTTARSANPRPSRSRPSGLVFWLLVTMGFAAFAPCVLLPEWRTYQSLHLAEQFERQELRQVEARLEREQRELAALQSDPAAVARLARRDLRFHRPGETVVEVPLSRTAAHSAAPPPATIHPDTAALDEPFVPVPPAIPAWLQRWTDRLPAFNYDAVFCHDETRTTVMALSLGLIALAVVLYRDDRGTA